MFWSLSAAHGRMSTGKAGGVTIRRTTFRVRPHEPSRKSFGLEGGTTFHFVTTGIHAALQRATGQHVEGHSSRRRSRRRFGNIFVCGTHRWSRVAAPAGARFRGNIYLAISM